MTGLRITESASPTMAVRNLGVDGALPWLRLRSAALPLLIGGVAAITALSFLGRWSWPLDLLSFGRQHLLVAAMLLAILAWAIRRKGWSMAAMVVAAGNLIAMAPSAGSDITSAVAAMPGTPLRVVALNVLNENNHSNSVVSFLRSTNADVISLEEVNSWWRRQLAALDDLYPYRLPVDGARENTTVLLSRYPIHEADLLKPPRPGFAGPGEEPLRAVIEVGGTPVAIYAVHPPTPRSPEQWTTRNAQLEWLAATADERDGGSPRVMLGDFNTPPWSFLFQDVIAKAGLRDAGGLLRQATRQPMLIPPHLAWLGATVDHVLVSPDVGVAGFAVGPYVHSDHLPVIADLTLPYRRTAAVE